MPGIIRKLIDSKTAIGFIAFFVFSPGYAKIITVTFPYLHFQFNESTNEMRFSYGRVGLCSFENVRILF